MKKKQVSKIAQLSGENLKEVVWNSLNSVRSGDLTATAANAINGGSRELCRIVKLELQMLALSGKKPSKQIGSFSAKSQ